MKLHAKIVVFIGVAAVGFVLFAWGHLALLPLNAVVTDSSSEFHEIPLKKEERSAFAAILARYGEHYKEREDGIWITPRLYFDQRLRWTYTSEIKQPNPPPSAAAPHERSDR